MAKWLITRHAIAHAGESARRRFERVVIAGAALPPTQRNPVGYLRSPARINPVVTRFELVVDEIVNILKDLEP
jgi:hypothetical protein